MCGAGGSEPWNDAADTRPWSDAGATQAAWTGLEARSTPIPGMTMPRTAAAAASVAPGPRRHEIPDEMPGQPLGRAFDELAESSRLGEQGVPGAESESGGNRERGGNGRGVRRRSKRDASRERARDRERALAASEEAGVFSEFSPDFPPGSMYSRGRSRKRVLITVAVLALGCLGVTVAVVNSSGGGNGPVAGTANPQLPGADTPQLPGLGGGGIDPGVVPGDGDGVGDGVGDGTGNGADPGAGMGTNAGDPSGDASAEPGPGAGVGSEAGSAAPGGAGAAAYEEWAGPGCSTGHYREHGRVENGDAAWYTVKSGGYKGSYCDGRFSAVPMSGRQDQDSGSTATWSWTLDKAYERCAVAVYVPDSGRARDVAGNPTVYSVLKDPANSATGYDGFAVVQTKHRGSLVRVGSYPAKGRTFAVQMVDRGLDFGSEERTGAHHAAAQMKINCT
ncbi:hypothetical protein [Streptomyces paludis]|uniref:Adhesin n=1 Tax=Streptomyces paludis TaxID=2282738 RepID=A0A345HS89_9ACTN|nr:hypothetical protein [Streptomyces paludis]AXG79563.1 hypothetical protein DVK44_20045 [Streptomyces paludis]